MATATALQLKEDGNRFVLRQKMSPPITSHNLTVLLLFSSFKHRSSHLTMLRLPTLMILLTRQFQSGSYTSAEALYSKAIITDPTNPLLYTNRAMARLKLHMYREVIADCDDSLKLLSENMKAFYYKAQAQVELGEAIEALESSKKAYDLCSGIGAGGRRIAVEKGWERSLSAVTGVVLRCKKEVWEGREKNRLRTRNGLLEESIRGLERHRDEALGHLGDEEENNEARKEVKIEWDEKIDELKRVWDRAADAEGKRREVPDWAIDDITFSIMIDPVMVCSQSFNTSSVSRPHYWLQT
jgi:STIP1 family protein 1